jgi:ribose transport system permease protein
MTTTQLDTATTESATPTWFQKAKEDQRVLGLIAPLSMIAAVILFMAVAEQRFFRASNLELILLDSALFMPLAVAMTFVITQRGIDLSIGSVAALCGMLMAWLIKEQSYPAWIGVAIAISVGSLCGLLNGIVITKFKVPDLIGTLAMDLVYRGIALVFARGIVLARFPDTITTIGRGRIQNFLPVPVLIGIATFLLGWVALKRTRFGRYTVAIGSNPEATSMTGVSVDRYKVYAYVAMGAAAGLAGVMLTGKLNAIQATSAPFVNLHVIAAVVVGGTSLFGGRASLLGSFSGVLLLSMMINALIQLRIEFFWQSVASGAVIIFSVALYVWLQKVDRDRAVGGFWRSLRSPANQSLLRLFALTGGTALALVALGSQLG